MEADRKLRWKKEADWLLSVTDYIVEFVPSQQKSKDGTTMEVEYICNINIVFAIVGLNLPSSLLTDNDHTTAERSTHEHSSVA